MDRTLAAAIGFVLIWSTGFVVARGIAPLADGSVFLSARFALCVLLFGSIALATRSRWPERSLVWRLMGIGALLQGVYLAAGFWAVGRGLQPGVMALLGALQPPLTAVLAARFYHEPVHRLTIAGLVLGVCGVALAVWPDENLIKVSPLVLLVACVSIAGITAGTLLQRSKVGQVPIMASSAIQNLGAMLVCLCLAFVLGESRFAINAHSLAMLAYTVCVLSLGGTTLLIWMVRTGNMTRATSLLFLVPPLAAILSWLWFDDRLTGLQISGFGLALTGVWLARKATA